MRRPFDQAHRIPFGFKQLLQVPLQGRIGLRRLLPPAPCLADPPLRSRSLSLQLFDPSWHRFPICSRQRGYQADATIADLERFCSQKQAPLLFIQFFPQNLILLLCRHNSTLLYFSVIWKLFADEFLDEMASRGTDLCLRVMIHSARPSIFAVQWMSSYQKS